MKFGVRLERNSSVKQMQSEMGVTGEATPNIDIVNEVVDYLTEHFEHEHNGHITENDCILLVSNLKLGCRLDNKEPALLMFGMQKGCDVDKDAMLYCLLKSDRELFEIARDVLRRIILENVNDALRGINDRIDNAEE